MNHYLASVERLRDAEDARASLDQAYMARPKDPVRIAYLNDNLRHNMAVSRMHAHLAEVHALYDLRASVDSLFQALTAEPDYLEDTELPALRVLEGMAQGVAPTCPNCEGATYSGTCPDCADGRLS